MMCLPLELRIIKQTVLCFLLLMPALLYGQKFAFQQGIDAKVRDVAIAPDGALFFIDELGVIKFSDENAQVQTYRIPPGVRIQEARLISLMPTGAVVVYDKAQNQIAVIPKESEAYIIKPAGKSIGALKNTTALEVDQEGYLYLLNEKRKQVDVFTPEGSFVTWIDGGATAFSKPVDIAINKANELHVLDAKGNVHVFDSKGVYLRQHLNLNDLPGVSLNDPVSIEALADGSFTVADRKTCMLVHFDAYGRKIGTIGSKGSGTPGTFAGIGVSAASHISTPEIVVADVVSGKLQTFVFDRRIGEREAEANKPRMVVNPYSGRPVRASVTSAQNIRYIIPDDDPTALVAYKNNTEEVIFALTGAFKEAYALACDNDGNVLVVDRKAKRVEAYSPDGAKMLHFGDQGKNKLKDPVGVAVQKSGVIVVADKGAGALNAYTTGGVFDRVLVGSKKAGWKSISAIRCDSKDQIYVFDEGQSAILRTGINGWPMALQRISVRGMKHGKKAGQIADFTIDRFDQIHVINSSCGQIETFFWDDVEPVLLSRFGLPAGWEHDFSKSDRINIDRASFTLFVNAAAEKKTRVYTYTVKPPSLKDDYHYRIAGESIVVSFDPIDANFITGYRLIGRDRDGNDSLVAESVHPKFTLKPATQALKKAPHYRVVSVSQTVQSDPNEGFTDYFSFANRLLVDRRFDEALPAFGNVLSRMGASTPFRDHVARKLSETGELMVNRGDVSRAMPFLRMAHQTSPDDPAVISAYGKGFSSFFKNLLEREDVSGILAESKRLMMSRTLEPIVLSALDTVSSELSRQSGERAITRAILLQRKMVEWAPKTPEYQAALAASLFRLYRFRKNTGATLPEMESLLSEAERYATHAADELKKQQKPHLQPEVTLLEILVAEERYDEVEQRVMARLSERSDLKTSQENVLKLMLCEAYKGRGQYGLAAEAYALIVETEPQRLDYKERLADALAKTERYDEAQQIYQKLLIGDRSNARYTAAIGRIELMRGNFVEASYQLEKAVRLDPNDASFHGPLAEAFQASSNLNKAIEHYDLAIRYEEALITLNTERLAGFSKVEDARERLKGYLEAAAQLSDQLGRYAQSLEFQEKLIAKYPLTAEYHYQLGNTSLRAGLVYDAEKSLYRACELEPANKTYTSAHEVALKERTRVAKNQDPLTIVDARISDIFPSLYRNYADPSRLPIGEILIANNTDGVIIPDEITVFIDGVMPAPAQVNTTNLVGYSNTLLKLGAILPESVLQSARVQQLQVEIAVRYRVDGKKRSFERAVPFTLHARNAIHWEDKRRLASFVTSGADELMQIGSAIENGFQELETGGINEPLVKAAQIYTALRGEQFKYVPDPEYDFSVLSSGKGGLDYVQFPAETMVRRQGDCDDFVVLLAGLLENSGVQTAYVDVPGHVFLAFDTELKPHQLAMAGLSIRDVIIEEGRVWIPLETTLIGNHDFLTAWRTGVERYNQEMIKGNFPDVVSMSEARKIYAPAHFVPSKFDPRFKINAPAMNEFNGVLSEMRLKLRQEFAQDIESRYHREPQNVYVKNKYAILLAKAGDLDRAEGVLLEALDLSPENATVLTNLGNVNYLKSLHNKAIEYYSKAFELNKDAEICINLHKTHLESGSAEEAERWLKRAREIEPSINTKNGLF